MSSHLFRPGTVLKLRTGHYRVVRAFTRGQLLYYDLAGTHGHQMPDVHQGMITSQLDEIARFAVGDHAQWKGKPCRVTGRGWSVPDQCIRYSIELEGRAGTLARIPESELATT